jgi:hypothetical protein
VTLSHHALAVGAIRGALRQHRGQMLGEAALIEPLVLRLAYHDDPGVCLQSNPTVEWPLWLLLGL